MRNQTTLKVTGLLVASILPFTLAGCGASAAPVTFHGQAHICTTRAYSGLTPANPPYLTLDDNTEFTCPGVGEKTIPQLAATGWYIGQPQAVPNAMRMPAAPPGPPTFTWKILIQSMSRIEQVR